MELIQAQLMTTTLPNDDLFRECIAMDMLCKEAVQFTWDGYWNVVGFRYIPPTFHWSRCREYPWVLETVPVAPTDRILDAGGGHGPLQYLLAQRAYHGSVTNADQAEESFALVRQHPLGALIQCDHQDLTHLSYPNNHFDKVVCISVIEHIPDQRAAVRELVRVLKPGGYLVLTCDVPVTWEAAKPTAETLKFDPAFPAMLRELGVGEISFPINNLAIGLVDTQHLVVFMGLFRKPATSSRN